MKRIGIVWVMTGLAISLWSGCTTSDEVFESAHVAHVAASFQLTAPSAMKGSLSIDEAYLKLSHIDAIGSRQDKNITTLTHQIPADEPPYRLSKADSNQVSFDLPSRTYDQLYFDLFLFQDTYELIITNNQPVEESPVEEPDGNDGDGDGDQGGDNDGDSGNDNDDGDDDNDSGDHDDDDNDSGDNDDSDKDEDEDDDDDDDSDEDDDNDSDEGDDDDDGDSEDDDGDSDDDGKGKNDDNKGKSKGDKNNGGKDNKGDDDDDDGRVSKNQSVDIDHFFGNAKPGLVVTGTYRGNGKILKLIFVVNDLPSIRLTGRQNDSPAIMLQKQNRADVLFNPEKLFESVTDSQLASSSIQTYQGQQIIFIHRDFNTSLFDALISRLELSAELNLIALADEPGM